VCSDDLVIVLLLLDGGLDVVALLVYGLDDLLEVEQVLLDELQLRSRILLALLE